MDEEDELSNVYQPSLPEHETDEVVGEGKVAITDQCKPVPELDDSRLVDAALPTVEGKGDGAITDERTPANDPEVEAKVDAEAEVTVLDTEAEFAVLDTEAEVAVLDTEAEVAVLDTEAEVDTEADVAKVDTETEVAKVDTETEVAEADTEAEEAGAEDAELDVEAELVAADVEASLAVAEAGAELAEADKEAEVVAGTEDAELDVEAELVAADVEASLAVGEAGAELAEADTEAEVAETEADVEDEMADADVELETVAEAEAEADADVELEVEAEVAEADAEIAEAEVEVADDTGKGGGKRKRGRNSKVPVRAPPRKKVEEDVCFICFDGGELVLCDRRGCPKAYHPSCVNRDEAFFRAKGRWNCGWHLCSICEKNAYYMCYTCTYSLCKVCIKDAVILCVRGNKGLCEACMRTVMLIEKKEQGNKEMGQVDFDDQTSWEYLFKDYWMDLKTSLSLTLDEVAQAKNPWRGPDVLASKQELPEELYEANNDGGFDSDGFSVNVEVTKPKRRKTRKLSKSFTKEVGSPSTAEGASTPGSTEWASKELLEFVMHMKSGDRSILSQFDVQALLLEYIKRNKLRDPRRKSQIICDSRLQNLFGKARVGHFEMLKLLESHFFIKEDSQGDDLQGSVVDTEASHLEVDGTADILTKTGKDRRRKLRKRGDERGPQSNLDDYAAIDMHNINLIYLRRSLMEDLLGDIEKFDDKVIGSFVRIRISGSAQKQDIYRLVQVVGTSKAAEPYKVGKKTTDMMLEILNLDKTEIISIDIISNQEFTEDEGKRLRQSIKCGLINRLTVGDVLEKAMALHAVRVNDWLETEIVRLSHLRDRASEKGRRKELRECVEKLQILKTAEERQRRLDEIPDVHADPNMDPSHESEEDESGNEKKQESYMRPRGSGFGRRGREPVSPGTGGSASNDLWSGLKKNSSKNWELNRSSSSKGILNRGEDAGASAEIIKEYSWNQGRDRDLHKSNNGEKLKPASNLETGGWNDQALLRSESFSGVALATPGGPQSVQLAQSVAKISETEKIWHYQDPSKKVQGPFSMVQLRKWSNTGYFPVDLRIWKTTEKQDDSILLTDALAHFFPKEKSVEDPTKKTQQMHNPHLSSRISGKPYGTPLQKEREDKVVEILKLEQIQEAGNLGHSTGENWRSQSEISSSKGGAIPPSVEIPKFSRDGWADYGNRSESVSLPSPTPTQSTAGWTGMQSSENRRPTTSFNTESGQMVSSSASLMNPTGAEDSSILSHALSQQTIPVNREHVMKGFVQPTSASNLGGLLNQSSENNSSSLTGLSSATKSENDSSLSSTTTVLDPSRSTVVGESHGVQTDIHPCPAPDLAAAMKNLGADASNAVGIIPNSVPSIISQNASAETHGWGPGPASKPDQIASCPMPGGEAQTWSSAPPQRLEPNSSFPVSAQQPVHGNWPPPPPHVHNSSGNFPSGSFPTPGFAPVPPSDHWRPPGSGNQWETGSNFRPPPPNMPWSMGVTGNPSAPSLKPENPNTPWGPMPGNPNMVYGGPPTGSTNMSWGAFTQGSAPGNANPNTHAGPPPPNPNMNWGAPLPGPMPGNANPGPASGNTNVNWGGVGLGPPPGNANAGTIPGSTNMNWGVAGTGPVPGNANPSWVAPTGNPGMWTGDQNHNGDRFTGQRDRNWNRQSSLGGGGPGGSSRPPLKAHRVCKYHENGHCKKGASCDYLHN